MVFQHQRKVKSVERWCFSIERKSIVVFQHRRKVKSVERWCFINEKEKAKKLMDGVVSSMKNGEEMVDCSVLGVGRIKSVEQCCFSIGKNDEKLLAMVFQQRKRKGETIAGRCCFVDKEW
jgi:hypothetical protein